jgi:hypothetical protein
LLALVPFELAPFAIAEHKLGTPAESSACWLRRGPAEASEHRSGAEERSVIREGARPDQHSRPLEGTRPEAQLFLLERQLLSCPRDVVRCLARRALGFRQPLCDRVVRR